MSCVHFAISSSSSLLVVVLQPYRSVHIHVLYSPCMACPYTSSIPQLITLILHWLLQLIFFPNRQRECREQ